MPLLSQTQFSFSAGELAPALYARGDLEKYQSDLKVARNVFVHVYGGVSNRSGTYYVGRPADGPVVRLIPFQFSRTQTYILVFGHETLRVITGGGFVLEGDKVVTAASPGRIEVKDHQFRNGEEVSLSCPGSKLDGSHYLVGHTEDNAFVPLDLNANPLPPNTAESWSGEGTVARVYTRVTTIGSSVLGDMTYAQSFDRMILAHNTFLPKQLSRKNHNE